MPKSKTKNKKKSNKLTRFFSKFDPTSRKGFALLFIVLFALVGGGYMLYHSLAAGVYTVNDEMIQYTDIDKTRASKGLLKLKPATCLNTRARNWSKTMSTQGVLHHSSTWSQEVTAACGVAPAWAGENVGLVGNSCLPTSTVDTCSQAIYNGFLNSPPHYSNIISPQPNYYGVGAYRDDRGRLWVTQVFVKSSYPLATYSLSKWSLVGKATASSDSAARATNATVHKGENYRLYNDIINNGPDNASFSTYTLVWHYNSAGTLLTTQKKAVRDYTLGPGKVYVYAYDGVAATTWPKGEKVCSMVYFSNATGPNTGQGHSNKTCVTVN